MAEGTFGGVSDLLTLRLVYLLLLKPIRSGHASVLPFRIRCSFQDTGGLHVHLRDSRRPRTTYRGTPLTTLVPESNVRRPRNRSSCDPFSDRVRSMGSRYPGSPASSPV